VAECAIFERYNIRKKEWTPVDPPPQLVRTLLAREKRWQFPQVSGIITTPTLRFDGSLLCTPGYDQRSELYLVSGLTLPPIPEKPSDAQALTGLDMLKDLFSEFSFQQAGLDCSVALAGLLTALLRGSLPTSPVCLVRGDGPGVGKSMLVDIIAMITTGRLCPVITMSKNLEETEKRIGAVLLSGSSIVSLDNITRDLEGELLCQLTERPIVRIRILGRSEMPDCECHTAVFATGNGVGFAGDMTRRGILCNLQALTERPELREFKRDTLAFAANNRGAYVAAALTIVRAYLSAGAPRICGPLGSYAAWSQMVRAPLIWLGEKDPVSSMDEIRAEDPQLAQVREFFQLWNDYRLDLNMPFTVARILELIDIAEPKGGLNPPGFREFLLKIARERHRAEVSPERFGWWLRRNAGRIVNGYRLIKGRDSVTKNTNYTLVKA
jgi:putative DNA primase/helicase